ncbi:microtubule-associated protein futsch-like [Argopecten irradians]|uniref:microtubule-associated protein futsch-like n=1 Tax=Argopecten irradians TaxID=31199 RepID=UPI0037161C5C
MASKRSLYRPAPQQNVVQRKNRKPLTQGRLVSDASEGHKKKVLASGIEENAPASRNGSYRAQQTTRQKILDTSVTHTGQEPESVIVTPRRMAPSITEHRSPAPSNPAMNLDLSDSDIDLSLQYKSPTQRIHKQKPQEVLLIDASRQTKDPNESEVDIQIGFERSPVKIICHSPSAIESSLRASAEKARDRTRDKNVSISSAVSLSEPVRDTGRKAPVVIREKANTDGTGRHHQGPMASLPLLTQIEQDLQIRQTFPQPNFDDSSVSSIAGHPGRDVLVETEREDAQSMVSDVSDVCSLDEYVIKAKKTTKLNPTKKAPTQAPASAKKKGRIVPSRYKQAAASHSQLAEKSLRQEKSSKGSKSIDVPSRPTSRHTKTKKPATLRITKEKERPCTPDNSQLSTGAKTSTPTMDNSIFPTEIDASAIQADSSILSTGHRSHVIRTPSKDGAKRNLRDIHDPFSQSILSNASVMSDMMDVSDRKQTTRAPKSKWTQRQMDLLYMRYIQWQYLYSKARKCREELEKREMAQMNTLHEELEILRKKNHDLDLRLERQKHVNLVDDQVDHQRQLLGPIVANLPKLSREYESLAHALDTTRHQIPTQGVYLPDDEEQLQRKLEKELATSEQLLGELSVMTRQPLTTVTAMSKALEAMQKGVDAQTHELKQCTEMIAATQSLTIQETSLRIQEMQV